MLVARPARSTMKVIGASKQQKCTVARLPYEDDLQAVWRAAKRIESRYSYVRTTHIPGSARALGRG